MLDVDYFKKFNDHYGHFKGDDSLRQLAQTLMATVERRTDVVARFDGEEFVIILPETNHQGAEVMAAHIRDTILKLALPHGKSNISDCVTISLGIVPAGDRLLTDGDQLVALADQAMYRAKKNGRNRYEMAAPSI